MMLFFQLYLVSISLKQWCIHWLQLFSKNGIWNVYLLLKIAQVYLVHIFENVDLSFCCFKFVNLFPFYTVKWTYFVAVSITLLHWQTYRQDIALPWTLSKFLWRVLSYAYISYLFIPQHRKRGKGGGIHVYSFHLTVILDSLY